MYSDEFLNDNEESSVGSNAMEKKLGVTLFVLQATFVILFAIFGKYAEESDSTFDISGHENSFHRLYPMFQDVHVMIFIGFGFLMTFLRKYGYSAVGYNFLLSAIAIQWYTIVNSIIKIIIHPASEPPLEGLQIPIDMVALVEGDFAAGAILISFGVVLGKTSPCQLLCLILIEIPLYTINMHILVHIGTADAGGSMIIHAFGAYFGIAVSLVLRRNWKGDEEDNASVYHSDLFSMVGTVFLWIYWPSFNGVLLGTANQQHRAAVNTYMSLCACVLAAFGTSILVDGKAKISMVHVQNATLAGGVAVGTTANFMIMPYGAAIIGTLAGILSTLGYQYVGPFLQDKAGLHDTCGVHNLHGMPAILAGLAGIVGAYLANVDSYGVEGLAAVFPKGGDVAAGVTDHTTLLIVQAGALGITLIVSIVGGLVTGAIIRFAPFCDAVPEELIFRDDAHFIVPDDAGFTAVDDVITTKDYSTPHPDTRPPSAITRPPTATATDRV